MKKNVIGILLDPENHLFLFFHRIPGESAGKIITDTLIEKYGIQEPDQPKKVVVTKFW